MSFWEAQQNLTLLEWFLRAIVMYLYLFLLTKLMGQREIGRLTLFDFIVSITIGSILGGLLTASNTELPGPAIALATLAGAQILLGYIALKFSKLRRVFEEEPIILIQNGKLLQDAMKKTRVNLDDLLSLLREKGYFNLNQVEFAVFESSGKLSVLPKSQNRPVTPADLNISTRYEGYPTVLIEDGNVVEENLKLNNLNKGWLFEQLHKHGIKSPKEVFAAILDTQGRLFLSLQNTASERTSLSRRWAGSESKV